jgi:menaquinone-dependent protoporphyrinogen oxidase
MIDGEEDPMTTLVAYASRYGATQGIAERIGARLTGAGQPVELRSVKDAGDLAGYDAFVIGSAAYMGSWLKEAKDFTRAHRAVLSTRPLWLFSSGPLGTATIDPQGRDLLAAAAPKEFGELAAGLGSRDQRVFFGALDRGKLRGAHRVVGAVPAGRKLLIEGDFRDWAAIDAWADGIARALGDAAPVEAVLSPDR